MKAMLMITLLLSCTFFNLLYHPVIAKPVDKLAPSKVEDFIKSHSTWTIQGNSLVATFTFNNGFKGAVDFVQSLVKPSDTMNHHPDIKITYNTVQISLSTHDMGGLTHADLELAEIIQKVYLTLKK